MSSTIDVIDFKHIKTIVSRACGSSESIEVVKYQLKPYSKYRVGFLSNHQKLEVTIKRDNSDDSEHEKLSCFVKSLSPKVGDNFGFIREESFFVQEAEFFNKVMPQFLDVVSVGDVEPWAPKCYLANPNIVVLEDLKAKGFAMLNTKLFEKEILESAVRSMARMHAASILTEKKLGKPLNELYPEACIEQVFTEPMKLYGSKLFLSLIVDVAKKNGRGFKGVEEGMRRGFDYIIHEKHEERVMCHGDTWSNNYLFDLSKPLPKCRLVDFQLVRYAPQMFDLAALIYLTTTRETRKKEERRTIEAYWSEVCETLMRCDPDVERPSLENNLKDYDKARLVAQMSAIIYFPTVLLNKDLLEEYKDDETALYKKFVYRQNNDEVLELMEKDAEYGSRITDVVLEFVETCGKLESKKPEDEDR